MHPEFRVSSKQLVLEARRNWNLLFLRVYEYINLPDVINVLETVAVRFLDEDDTSSDALPVYFRSYLRGCNEDGDITRGYAPLYSLYFMYSAGLTWVPQVLTALLTVTVLRWYELM